MSHFRSAALGSVAVLASLAGATPAVRAATPLTALRYASDITVTLGGTTITPADVAEDDLAGVVTPVDVGNLPADAHVDAYQQLVNGDQLLSFDTAVVLPGGVLAGAADVVRFAAGAYTIAFDAAANGVPEGVNVDAVAVTNGDLLLSFDTSVRLGGTTFEDEDLVRFASGVSAFAAFFTGSDAGVPPDLDLDGAQVLAGQHLLVSFDGSGSVGGVAFDDDDVLEYDAGAGSWEIAYRGAAHHAGWEAADLVALYALVVGQTPTPTATSVPSASTPTSTATPISSGTVPATSTATETPTGSPPMTPTTTPTTPSGTCVGDCNGSGEVTVNELVTMVNIALGNATVSSCLAGDPNGSGTITIEELIAAVNNALNGC